MKVHARGANGRNKNNNLKQNINGEYEMYHLNKQDKAKLALRQVGQDRPYTVYRGSKPTYKRYPHQSTAQKLWRMIWGNPSYNKKSKKHQKLTTDLVVLAGVAGAIIGLSI